VTPPGCSRAAAVAGLAAAAAIAFTTAAGAQAPLVTPPEALPAPSGPEPLWVPDPEPVRTARPDEPAAADAGAPLVAEAAGTGGPAAAEPSQVAIAHWMAQGARAAGLPGELPVMAALGESGLRNLPYGDRDSVGYFQMRTGIWDGGPYAGYLTRPELQLRWFVDRALGVRAARVAAGDGAFGTDPAAWGAWIADVERPAERYRARYQERLDAARRLLAVPAPALAAFELALTVDGSPAPAAGPVAGPLVARTVGDPRIGLSDGAREDLLAGRIDPRVQAVLLHAAELAPISVSVLQSGHSYRTTSGSISNHAFGRAADIATVGGEPVRRANAAARALALALGELAPEVRPTEIGTPWAIDAPGYFTDADHQDHLHVGFDDPAAAGAVPVMPTAAAVTASAPPRPESEPAEPRFAARAEASGEADRRAASEPRFRPAAGRAVR
jgi:hypothetical protein